MRAERKTYEPIWDVDGAERYFASVELPDEPLAIFPWEIIVDMQKFIEGHIGRCRAQNGNPLYIPYWHRLRHLKTILEKMKNDSKQK